MAINTGELESKKYAPNLGSEYGILSVLITDVREDYGPNDREGVDSINMRFDPTRPNQFEISMYPNREGRWFDNPYAAISYLINNGKAYFVKGFAGVYYFANKQFLVNEYMDVKRPAPKIGEQATVENSTFVYTGLGIGDLSNDLKREDIETLIREDLRKSFGRVRIDEKMLQGMVDMLYRASKFSVTANNKQRDKTRLGLMTRITYTDRSVLAKEEMAQEGRDYGSIEFSRLANGGRLKVELATGDVTLFAPQRILGIKLKRDERGQIVYAPIGIGKLDKKRQEGEYSVGDLSLVDTELLLAAGAQAFMGSIDLRRHRYALTHKDYIIKPESLSFNPDEVGMTDEVSMPVCGIYSETKFWGAIFDCKEGKIDLDKFIQILLREVNFGDRVFDSVGYKVFRKYVSSVLNLTKFERIRGQNCARIKRTIGDIHIIARDK